MPSRERREREKRVRESRREFEAAIREGNQRAIFHSSSQGEVLSANAELGLGAERYLLRGVKFTPEGDVIPLPNWGRNDTWLKNKTAAEQKVRALRLLAGHHWGNTKMIRWLRAQAAKVGLPVPCERTLRRYFKYYP